MTLNGSSWPPKPHPCPRCGSPTIFRVCDVCVSAETAQTTPPLTPLARARQRAEELRRRRMAEGAADGQQPRSLDDVHWLADIGEIGGAADGDEWAKTLAAWRAAPEQRPDARWWSGVCWWCAKEIREQSGDDDTHRPPLSRIRTCYRHRKALLALSAWLRHEKFGRGQTGGAA